MKDPAALTAGSSVQGTFLVVFGWVTEKLTVRCKNSQDKQHVNTNAYYLLNRLLKFKKLIKTRTRKNLITRLCCLGTYEDLVVSDKGSTRRTFVRFTTKQSYDRKFACTTK